VIALLLQSVPVDWTLVTALLTSNGALVAVVVLLWYRYNQARDRYDALLIRDRDELVPEMTKLAAIATNLNANANKLLEESVKLRTYRRGEGATGDSSP
jgi:hypothetical protein